MRYRRGMSPTKRPATKASTLCIRLYEAKRFPDHCPLGAGPPSVMCASFILGHLGQQVFSLDHSNPGYLINDVVINFAMNVYHSFSWWSWSPA